MKKTTFLLMIILSMSACSKSESDIAADKAKEIDVSGTRQPIVQYEMPKPSKSKY